MKEKLGEKFASVDHAGPADVAAFMEAEGEDAEQIQALISGINSTEQV